jgi:hypothetical protein
MGFLHMLLDEISAPTLEAAGATIERGSANEPYLAVEFPDAYIPAMLDQIARKQQLCLLETVR